MTSLILHCRGWISVWIDPVRPCFLGTCPTNLNDTLVQQTRWAFGLLQMASSKFSPLLYAPFRMSLLQTMSYGGLTLDPFYAFPFYGLGIIPAICLLYGIPLYPKVRDFDSLVCMFYKTNYYFLCFMIPVFLGLTIVAKCLMFCRF